MNPRYEYCPHCNLIREMGVTISLKRIGPTQDECDSILMWVYHCERCFSFVRMEPVEQLHEIRYHTYKWSNSPAAVA